jgi:hypothetical protein
MMARFVRLRFAAAAMIAAATIAATTAPSWAFTQQTVNPEANGNYNFNYTDPNHPNFSSQSSPSDPSTSGFHLNIEQNPSGPFGFQGGNRFNNGGSNNVTSPNYYIQPSGGN